MMSFFGLGKYPEEKKKKTQGLIPSLDLDQEDESEEIQARKLKNGRYWMWKEYLPENYRKEFERGEKMFKHIHRAVLYDIQDYIIRKGMDKKRKTYEDCIRSSLFSYILQCLRKCQKRRGRQFQSPTSQKIDHQ